MTSGTAFPGTILHISTARSFRGGERQASLLHAGLLERGYASVLACRASGELSRQSGSHLAPIPWHGEADVAGLWRLFLLCRKNRPVIIHCHDAHALSHGSIIGAMTSVPVVYTRRVIFPPRNNAFSRWKYSRCAAILAISSAVAEVCGECAPREKIRVVPDGVSWKTPGLSRKEARTALGIPHDCFAIGTVGHFTPEKNLPLIVTLAAALSKQRPSARIVCIGPAGPGAVSPAGNLVLSGYRPDAASYYAAFDLYVSASTHEGLGSALLDAIVRDIPAVAVDGGGTRDLFPEGWPLVRPGDDAGFISATIDAIDDYAKAASAAAGIGNRARGMFSVDSMVEKTLEAYQAIV